MAAGLHRLLLLATFLTSAAHAEDCAEVYAQSVANISIKTLHNYEFDYLWNKHCETTGELKKESAGLDLTSAVTSIVGVGIGFSKQEASQRMQQFCKEHLQEQLKTTDSYNFDRQIVVASQKSFNECRALELSSIHVSHAVQEPRSVVIRADFDPSKTKVMFRSLVYNQKVATCSTSALSSAQKPEVITPTTKPSSVEPFAVVCERIGSKTADGSLKFDRFTAALDTNFGTYTVELPTEEMLGFDLASLDKSRYEKLVAVQNNLTQQNADLLKRIAGVTAEVHYFSTGQDMEIPCEGRNPEWFARYAKGICGEMPYSVTSLSGEIPDNRKCGIHHYGLACINVGK